MKIYHTNPETNRINICQAKNGNCKFGSDNPHFTDREKAQQFIEKKFEEENGSFSTLTKIKTNTDKDVNESNFGTLDNPFPAELVREQLNLLSKEGLDHLIKERYKISMTKKEVEQAIENEEPFYVDFNGNQEMNLDTENYETQRTFMRGACSVLANELYKATDWQIVSFTDKKMEEKGFWQGHVSLKTPEGEYLDIEGAKTKGYGEFFSSKYREEEISHEELINLMGKQESGSLTKDLGMLEKYAVSQLAYNLLESEGYIKG